MMLLLISNVVSDVVHLGLTYGEKADSFASFAGSIFFMPTVPPRSASLRVGLSLFRLLRSLV